MSPDRACQRCIARSALLGQLSARIDHAARDLPRLVALLENDDEQLIQAIGGRHREALRTRRRELLRETSTAHSNTLSVCPHTRCTPTPHAFFYLTPSIQRYSQALARPRIAIVGCVRASEYGQVAASRLAATLASSGVQVLALLAEGVSSATHAGVLAARERPLAVCPSGLDGCFAQLAPLRRTIEHHGCLLAQLPQRVHQRRWSLRAAGCALVELADLVVVIEAEERSIELEIAEHARSLGRLVAAVPGQIGHNRSVGPHALLRSGAPLVASAQDALDLLHGVGLASAAARPAARIEAPLRAVLDRISAGEDTLEALLADDRREETLVALAQLEAAHLVARAASGRYFASGW